MCTRKGRPERIEIKLEPHAGIRGRCSQCQRPAPGYDRLPERRWQFVPLWGIPTYFYYAPRRVECGEHGVLIEHIPWSEGKRRVTCAMMVFLARWARRLSWRETAQVFGTSWEAVYRSVEWLVEWGLAQRELQGVESIGVDEIHWGHGVRANNFLTVIYQIDAHCRRLLWVGKRRSQATLRRGLKALGPEVVKGLRFVCSDMWTPYLKVLAAEAGQALQVLDRFHITTHLNQAVDRVRRGESTRLRAVSQQKVGTITKPIPAAQPPPAPPNEDDYIVYDNDDGVTFTNRRAATGRPLFCCPTSPARNGYRHPNGRKQSTAELRALGDCVDMLFHRSLCHATTFGDLLLGQALQKKVADVLLGARKKRLN